MFHFLKSFVFLFLLFGSSPSFANIVGTDLQNFNPTSSGLDFVTVHSSDTLEEGVLNVGAFVTYATNSLPFFRLAGAPTNQKFVEPNDKLVASDVHFGLGLGKNWDIGASAAMILNQKIDDSAFLGTFERTGLADLRINTKYRFHKNNVTGAALVASVDFERVDNNPFLGQDAGPTLNLSAVWDRQLTKNWRWGVNGGFRLRNEGETIGTSGITPIGNQITYSTALNYDLRKYDSHVLLELFGSTPLEENSTPTDRKMSNLQGLVGWRWDVHKRLDVHAGLGTEVYHGLATPDVLIYAGFNWRMGPLWKFVKDKDSDKDGVPDSEDQCPQTPASERDEVNAVGCSDSDRDGVFNNLDQCPDTEIGLSVDDRGCVVSPEPLGLEIEEGDVNEDTDNDGVLNIEDQCPNTRIGVEVNDLGCDIKRVKDITLKNVNFYTGTARLTKASKIKMRKIVNDLLEVKDTIKKVIVEGHTDSVGKRKMNQKLSQFRANTVRKILINKVGFHSSEVRAIGYGEDRPVATNKTKKGRLINRRVKLRLIRSQ